MAITKKKLLIDVNEPINTQATGVKGDTLSRYLDVYLYDSGVPIDLTGHRVEIFARKKKTGETVQRDFGEITDATAGRCQFELKNSMLAEAVALDMQFVIWNGDTEILSTKVFTFLVTESLRNDEEVEASNEFGVLVVLFTEIQNALDLMKEMTDTFGLPGEMAEIYGTTTFWGMLENLAVRADVKQALKENVNSTMDAEGFAPLDQLLLGKIREIWGETHIFDKPGTYTLELPDYVTKVIITACAAGGGGACGYSVAFNEYGTSKAKGKDGGNTEISGLILLKGGKGGTVMTGGAAGGEGAGKGGDGVEGPSYSSNSDDRATSNAGKAGLAGLGGDKATVSAEGTADTGVGGGGGGSLGKGGDSVPYVDGAAEDGKKGGGGAGGSAYGGGSNVGEGGGGGGGGEAVSGFIILVGNTRTLTITVGKGGETGTVAYDRAEALGGKGGDGYVEISWGI